METLSEEYRKHYAGKYRELLAEGFTWEDLLEGLVGAMLEHGQEEAAMKIIAAVPQH